MTRERARLWDWLENWRNGPRRAAWVRRMAARSPWNAADQLVNNLSAATGIARPDLLAPLPKEAR